MQSYKRDENLIALSGDFHTHKRYHDFYTKCGQMLGGFVGVYSFIRDMGDELTVWEAAHKDAWERYDWVKVCENYVDLVITRALADKSAVCMPDLKLTLSQALDLSAI